MPPSNRVGAAGIEDFRFHDLRHTFASRLAMAGVALYTIHRAGAWKTAIMVQPYAHLSPDHMRAAVERLAEIRFSSSHTPEEGSVMSRETTISTAS